MLSSPVMLYSLVIVVFHACVSTKINSGKRLEVPSNVENKLRTNIHKFLNRTTDKNGKKHTKTTAHFNISMYVDGIAHFELKNRSEEWKKLKEIENDFKNMLKMKGMTFIYKRDMFWRTWRDVHFPNNSEATVFYKCSNIITTSCDDCYGGGFWIIDEDRISCPYEILSMLNKKQICVVNYDQIKKINTECPSVTSIIDLMISCDNPIITMYRVTKLFTSTSERNQTDICGGREYCDISTFYKIDEDYIIFRLINSTNDVIYSKIMKHDRKIYVCFANCGRFDPITKNVTKSDKKGKAQDDLCNNNNNTLRTSRSKAKGKKNNKTTPSPCRKLQITTAEDYEEDSYDYKS